MKRNGESGSALLIVFVFAAIVAITLYVEMPVAVFEARRQREQLTIDHGKEYAHAVKLFIRKIGRYPTSIDELQDTNRMRFLRHKFADPLTGKNDWRILHAGPNGTLIDSKVKPLGGGTFQGNTHSTGFADGNNGAASNANSDTNSAANAEKANAGSGQSEFPVAGSIAADAAAGTSALQPAAPQRPPAIAANGSGGSTAGTTAAPDDSQNPGASLVPPLPAMPTDTTAAAASNTQAAAANAAQAGNPAGANANSGAPGETQGQNSASGGQNLVNRLSGSGTQAGAGTGPTGGTLAAGGIAGVASIAQGPSIKAVNDQHKYSLWEFYYDPTKDLLKMPIAGVPQNNGANGTGAPGFATSTPANSANAITPAPGNNNQAGAGSPTTTQDPY
ncbi:MAG: hypothetical protein JO270_08105 [Acidobacteriaceae bacterium]|nr:hypothetical protein [Acidobacteriaceae bacterium]MBV8572307.1 hypothetical protein [Acidobacteriaceae bacterium]